MGNKVEQKRCFLCGSEEYNILQHGVRGGENVDVLKCSRCGLVRLSKFMENIDEFYKESNMRSIQEELRSIRIKAMEDDHRRYEFSKNYILDKKILDFGCGAGGFLHFADKIAKEVIGVELEEEMSKALNEEGICCFESLDKLDKSQKKFDIITVFHVLEHLPDPIQTLKNLSELLAPNGKMIIEVPNANDALLSVYHSQAFADFTYWICHLYLYTNETLSKLLEKAKLRVSFLQQVQRYPLSNHLYWLSHEKPGGHEEWAVMNDGMMDELYGKKLCNLGIADTIMVICEKEY